MIIIINEWNFGKNKTNFVKQWHCYYLNIYKKKKKSTHFTISQ